MGYRPDIDGLRAIAVLAVLFYHAELSVPGGFVGVDVFFVISGFLITGLLLKSMEKSAFSFRDFWERRVRRLVPALMAMTFVTAWIAPLILLPEDLKDLGGALVAQPLLAANIYFWRVVKGGYFGDAPEIRPLLHTWSLGIEEQFYVFFPPLLLVLHKLRNTRAVLPLALIALFLVSAFLSVFLTPIRSALAFFTLPTRAWELLLGALLATLLRAVPAKGSPQKFLRELLSVAGAVLIFVPCVLYYGKMPFPGSAAFVPCLGTALLIWANAGDRLTLPGKLLATAPMVFVGRISYSVYLWHWPLLAGLSYLGLLHSNVLRWTMVFFSLVLGYGSWRWLETPFRQRQWMARARSMLDLYVVYTVVCATTGALFVATGGFANLWHENVRGTEYRSRAITADPTQPEAAPSNLGASKSTGANFLLWGDSHAMSLAPLLHELGMEYEVSGWQLTCPSTAPLLRWGHELAHWDKPDDYKLAWKELFWKTIQEKKITTVFLSGYWTSYGRPEFEEDVRETLATLQTHGLQVVFIHDFPLQPRVNSRNLRLSSRWPQLLPTPISTEQHREVSKRVSLAIKGQGSLEIDPAEIVLRWPSLLENHHPLYIDSHHLSDYGALLLRPLFVEVFQQMAGAPRP